MSMRVAALCAEPDRRAEVKAVVDRAIGLERELWSGEPAPGAGSMTPAETAAALEELARAILKDAAAGHLGSDLRTTADEILLADGLAVGDGAAEQRGGTTEWDLEPVAERYEPSEQPDEPTIELEEEEPSLAEELDGITREVSDLDRRISPEPSPEPEEEMVIARARQIFGGNVEPDTAELEVVPDARSAAGRSRCTAAVLGAASPSRARREPGPAPDRADPSRAQGTPRPRRRALSPA